MTYMTRQQQAILTCIQSCDGGIGAASALIHRVLLDTEREEVAEEKRRDYKTLLQEFVQRTPNQTLSYRQLGESGPDHDKTFTFEVLLNGAVGAGGRAAARRRPSRWPLRTRSKRSTSAEKHSEYEKIVVTRSRRFFAARFRCFEENREPRVEQE